MRIGTSLRWKILIVTSLALTALVAITGVVVERRVMYSMSRTLESEAQASLQAYESLWKGRADLLGAVSLALAGTADVRAAFGTRDPLTIRDLARERWDQFADPNAFFLVADPVGHVIASLGGPGPALLESELPSIRTASSRFPQQLKGSLVEGGRLFLVVFTPVYVDSVRGPALLNVLVAGYAIGEEVINQLKTATGGSDFVFSTGGQVAGASLPQGTATRLLEHAPAALGAATRISDGKTEYVALAHPLFDVEQHRVGQLLILRPLTSAEQAMRALRKALSLVWLSAVAVGLALTWLLSNRLMLPIGRLDKAAAEIARENYDHRVPVESEDELGRLARTFNAMCVSIQRGREELIRQERLSTIGRLSSSLVHDLRNPLAAIYAGSEMLAEGGMPENQNRRLAANIHRASRHIQQMLKELVQVCRGKTSEPEACSLGELIRGAWDAISPSTLAHNVQFRSDVPDDLEVWVERARLQRVFVNLFLNSVEAMPAGGEIRVSVAHQRPMLSVSVEDNGPGLPEEVRKRIFEPFVSSGKRNGMGLGLALARQTMRENGGDLSVGESVRGARFIVRLPARENSAAEDGASGGDIEAPAQKVT